MSQATVVVIAAILVAGFVGFLGLFCIWLERKLCGRIQDRLGPTRVGGRFGWLQTIADGVKLIQKEDLIPARADRPLFRLAPYIVLLGSLCAYVALPFGTGWVAQNLNNALLFMLAIMSVEVFGVILAGYASGSKWSIYGGIREAAQMVSYEVPMAICAIIPIMIAGTLNLTTIADQQAGFFLTEWYLFYSPLLFLAGMVYLICAMASCKRAPFDLAEAESELVAGFHTEYSGLRWSFFFLAEYASMFAVSGIFAILFLGGWHGPLPVGQWLRIDGTILGDLLGVVNFVVKGLLLMCVMIWVRWTLPRPRIDQVMVTCLKYLLPISCALLLITAFWEAFCFDILPWGDPAGFPIDGPIPPGSIPGSDASVAAGL